MAELEDLGAEPLVLAVMKVEATERLTVKCFSGSRTELVEDYLVTQRRGGKMRWRRP